MLSNETYNPSWIMDIPDWVVTTKCHYLHKTNYEAFDNLASVVKQLLLVIDADVDALTAIIAQLHEAWLKGAMLSPSFNERAYRKRRKVGRKWKNIGKRYHVDWWSHTKVKGCFTALEDGGFTKRIPGYLDQRGDKLVRVSGKVWPTDKLIAMWEGLAVEYRTRTPELVRLTDIEIAADGKKITQLVDYIDCEYADGIRAFLGSYNEFLSDWKITRHDAQLNTELYCVFSRGRFEVHGRLYNTGGWMIYNEAERAEIIFEKDGQRFEAYEYDYASMHIALAEAFQGVELPNIDGDYYAPVCDYLKIPRTLRKAPKTMAFSLINSKTTASAIKSIRQDINFARCDHTKRGKPKRMTKKRQAIIDRADALDKYGVSLDQLADAVKAVHHKIGDWFGSDAGVYLMWHDAEIMRKVLARCMARGIPALPMHDSAVVPIPFAEDLREIMNAELNKHIAGVRSGEITLQKELNDISSSTSSSTNNPPSMGYTRTTSYPS